MLLNHVHRTWWFAEFIKKKREMKYDRELVYLASLLHDLGLSEDHAADKRFEVDGLSGGPARLMDPPPEGSVGGEQYSGRALSGS